MTDGPFSSLAERWSEISDFPGYSVSDHGRVRNDATGYFLTPTFKSDGLPMVGLMYNKKQCKRSLPLLVARAFVPRKKDAFDTPINLDGDRSNNHWTNLEWRPLWFARQYRHQFTDGHPTFNAPIEDVETRIVYESSMHAAIANGLLDTESCISMANNTYVWTTGQVFRQA